MVKQNTWQAVTAVSLIAIVGIFVLSYAGFIKPQQAAQPTGGVVTPEGYSAFPIEVSMPLKDATNPTTSVAGTTVTGRVYSSSTPDAVVVSPTTSYLDSATVSSGTLTFANKLTQTAGTYKVKLYDTAASAVWYPELITLKVPALPATYTGAYTTDNVLLSRIGSFVDPMQENATYGNGNAFATVSTTNSTSSTATNTVTLNISESAATTLTAKIKLQIGDGTVSSKLKNAVLRPVQDTTNGIPTTAFTAVTTQYIQGTNFNIPADLLSYVSGQTPITLGDLSDSQSGQIYLQLSIDKASVSNGQKFNFILDDNGNWLGTDAVAGQSGAGAAMVTVAIVA